jgi:hypothetical protein
MQKISVPETRKQRQKDFKQEDARSAQKSVGLEGSQEQNLKQTGDLLPEQFDLTNQSVAAGYKELKAVGYWSARRDLAGDSETMNPKNWSEYVESILGKRYGASAELSPLVAVECWNAANLLEQSLHI